MVSQEEKIAKRKYLMENWSKGKDWLEGRCGPDFICLEKKMKVEDAENEGSKVRGIGKVRKTKALGKGITGMELVKERVNEKKGRDGRGKNEMGERDKKSTFLPG